VTREEQLFCIIPSIDPQSHAFEAVRLWKNDDRIKKMMIKNLSVIHEFSYIDNSKIDNTCLNKSKLHLNDKGTSLLAVHFIKFVRGLASNSRRSSDRDKGFQMVLCKQLGEMLMKIGNLRPGADLRFFAR
jgi:hypothetical protein